MIFAVSAAPNPPTQPHTSSSPLPLIDRLLNYEKVERALVKLRGIFIAVCGPLPPHIYQNKNAFTEGKKNKIYRVLKGTVFLLLSAACPQSGSLFNGLLAPSCLLIGRISYRNGTGKESKLEGSTALQPSVCIQPQFDKSTNCRCCNISFLSGWVIPIKGRSQSSVLKNAEKG